LTKTLTNYMQKPAAVIVDLRSLSVIQRKCSDEFEMIVCDCPWLF